MLFMMRFQILQGHGMHGLLRDSFPVSRFLSKDDDVSGQPNSDGESLATDQNIPNALESCLQPLGDSTGDCIGTNNEGKIRNGYGENLRNRKAKWKAAGFAQYKKHEDHIRHKPEMLTEKELEDLVTFWSEDEGQQVLSERNTIKRSQQVVKHIGGKKSIARSIAEMTEKNGGVPPTEGDIFIKYHTSKKSKKAKNPVSEDFIVQMRERAGLDENGFDENDVKQSIPDYIYKEVVPAATRHRKRARVVEDGTTSCASSGYSSRIGELEQQVVDLKDIIFEKDKETERIIGELTKENDRRFKEFEKRMMDNVASLVFRPEQFFRPQEQVFIPQHPLYRGATSDPLYRAAISDPFYRAATSSSGEHGCSSRLH